MTDPTPSNEPWVCERNLFADVCRKIHKPDDGWLCGLRGDLVQIAGPVPPAPSSDTPSDERHALEQTADASFPNIPGIKRILLETYDQGRSHGIGHATILSLVYRCEKAEREVLALRHPAPSPTPEASGRPNRGDEVQIAGAIGNIVRMNDRDGTCDIAWWMPTGGPYGSSTSVDVPLDGLHVRQQATTSLPAPASLLVGERLDELRARLAEYDGRTLSEILAGVDGRADHAPVIDAVRSLLAAADRGER